MYARDKQEPVNLDKVLCYNDLMKIHQYYYKTHNGFAKAQPVTAEQRREVKKPSYPSISELPYTSDQDFQQQVFDIVTSFKEDVPCTTKAHLAVAHLVDSTVIDTTAGNWFAVAEAVISQEKEKITTSQQLARWENWLSNAWEVIVVPESFKNLFENCNDGVEALNRLREPDTAMLARLCMIAATTSPVDPNGLSMYGNPVRLSAVWSDRSKSLSFRAVYPMRAKTKTSEAFEETVFVSHTAGVFKLKDKWLAKANQEIIDRKDMQVRELLSLAHLVNPKEEDILKVTGFLQDTYGFSLAEILENELENIEKKNSILTRRLFEVVLSAKWETIFGQIEMLRMAEYKPAEIAAALVESFTKNVIKVDAATGEMDLPDLPDVLM